MKRLSTIAAPAMIGLIIAGSCSHPENEYHLNGKFDEKYNGLPVMLISMSSGDTLAYDTIRNNQFMITGDATTPDLAQLRIRGASAGTIILEPGVITFTVDSVYGTPLNELMNDYNKRMVAASQLVVENQSDSVKKEEALAQYKIVEAYGDSLFLANLDNPLGAGFMMERAYLMSPEDLEANLEQHPSLKAYSKITKILDQKKLAMETGVGKHYKDFQVTYNGKTTSLSDYIRPDHYTLVDFWASWCGPCRREIPVIKEILKEWGPKGLDVVGVAVWDEPTDTEKAIKELDITWPVIMDAKTIPTDIYGILGIPSIFLIGPDGTILVRDLGGNDLKKAVAKAMTE